MADKNFQSMNYLFYVLGPQQTLTACESLKADYSFEVWEPSIRGVVPRGVPMMPFGVWWAMHQLHFFKNRDYALLLIKDGSTLIHRSGVFPGYLRFPFMSKSDLQIGDTWTHPSYRKQGLAQFAICKIVERYRDDNRSFWYLVEDNNVPSIRVIEKAGFRLAGRGLKDKRFGTKLLGAYKMQTNC